MGRTGLHELLRFGEGGCGKRKQYFWMAKAGALSVALALCPVAKAQSASFDCGKATTKVEKMICADVELSKLDEELAKTYQDVLLESAGANSIKQQQKEWRKDRNRCADADCVKQKLQMRLQALSPTSAVALEPAGQGHKTIMPEIVAEAQSIYSHCVDKKDGRDCGRFQSGKGYTVCEKYLAYINSLSKMPRCEVAVPPGFERPNWEEMDVMQHLDWAYQMEMLANGYDWYIKENPNFDIWKKNFLADLQADRITPSMRKVKVTPFGKEEITILAYARDREGCKRVLEKRSKGSLWNEVGYSHFLFSETPEVRLASIPGAVGLMSFQSEMLLYRGLPYFVLEYDPSWNERPSIEVLRFDERMSRLEKGKYWVGEFCHFVEK